MATKPPAFGRGATFYPMKRTSVTIDFYSFDSRIPESARNEYVYLLHESGRVEYGMLAEGIELGVYQGWAWIYPKGQNKRVAL